jgi:hypothetical protein
MIWLLRSGAFSFSTGAGDAGGAEPMLGTEDVRDMERAAMQAQVDAEAAADELRRASKWTDGIDFEDEDELDEAANELRDSLQTAADALQEALHEVQRFL